MLDFHKKSDSVLPFFTETVYLLFWWYPVDPNGLCARYENKQGKNAYSNMIDIQIFTRFCAHARNIKLK